MPDFRYENDLRSHLEAWTEHGYGDSDPGVYDPTMHDFFLVELVDTHSDEFEYVLHGPLRPTDVVWQHETERFTIPGGRSVPGEMLAGFYEVEHGSTIRQE